MHVGCTKRGCFTCANSHTHAHTHTHTHTHTQIDIYTQTGTCTHTDIDTHTHTHTNTTKASDETAGPDTTETIQSEIVINGIRISHSLVPLRDCG